MILSMRFVIVRNNAMVFSMVTFYRGIDDTVLMGRTDMMIMVIMMLTMMKSALCSFLAAPTSQQWCIVKTTQRLNSFPKLSRTYVANVKHKKQAANGLYF